MSERTARITGRILFLTKDPALIARQLAGEDLDYGAGFELLDNVSTDEITPGWVCYYFDDTLARYCLVGLRGGVVPTDAVKKGEFCAIVSGKSKGCGSSRETAPYSELSAGIKLVIAESIEKIYRQNCQNIGLHTSTDFSLIERIRSGEPIALRELSQGLDPISSQVVACGGLFAYNRQRMAGELAAPQLDTSARPMTLCEKIIASHAIVDARAGKLGVRAVRPGDALFVRTDVRFSHEYVTPMAASLFRAGFGKDSRVSEPQGVFAFRDHLTFLERVMPQAHVKLGLTQQAASLKVAQEQFCHEQGIRLYGEIERDGETVGSEAICHNKVVEDLAEPGQVVAGTDSHTCMAGALGCLAFGVGSTDMANAWYTRDVRVRVPQTVRVMLEGALGPGVCAKDVMLHLLSLDYFKTGRGIGQVLEFSGSALALLPLDERATLANMAVEAGGFTGIMEADELVVQYLSQMRGLDAERVRALVVRADREAEYADTLRIDLSQIPIMVATPGDPRNGVPLNELLSDKGEIKIDIAYGGSCTGGKKADMDMYAVVLSRALARNKRVADGVKLFIQFGSQHIRRYAEERGYIELFKRAGAELVEPSCGACIRAGPGVSTSAGQVTVSAINRNYPGRSGPGNVYLASPLVVAASAVAGKIAAPDNA